MARRIINPQYPGMLAVDVMDHAMDLIRVARLAINAFEADRPTFQRRKWRLSATS
ncbi:hypothetical protein [Mesorhizobium sangaii]|uniref:Uncharacterized protein n=1 Tax=Mesorhizobium sangaii TaxID=505389 RepID=A0A841PJB5_9HYPH|nr:hypothetical protein [Mesorhizobium sangaii]MBB6410830.1 hypothetical protein [Mesorhizobium sangaii]